MPGPSLKYILLLMALVACHSGKLVYDEKKSLQASRSMKGPGHAFMSCYINADLDTCAFRLRRVARTAYEKNIVATTLYTMHSETAYQLHKQAYMEKPNELLFIRDFAMELHRKGNYEGAAGLYEKMLGNNPANLKVNIWLSDCYINTGQTEKSILSWLKADHARRHVEIETAIHDIYGKKDLYTKRNYFRNEIKKGNTDFFYDLFYLDLNWEYDWWNVGQTEEDCLRADIALLNEKTDKTSMLYNVIEAYVKIKEPEKSQYLGPLSEIAPKDEMNQQNDRVSNDYNRTLNEVEKEILEIIRNSIAPEDSAQVPPKEERVDRANHIREVLTTHSLVLNGNPLPPKGKVAADFLEVCFTNSVISRDTYFSARGEEVLKKAEELQDVDFLDIYAHLLPAKDPRILEINKKGWTKYKDERFAWMYLMLSLVGKNLNEKELDQAILDFPASSRIYLIKTQKAKLDNRNMAPYFTELIKKEFRAINSGIGLRSTYGMGHSSYPLKLYFELLSKELRPKQ